MTLQFEVTSEDLEESRRLLGTVEKDGYICNCILAVAAKKAFPPLPRIKVLVNDWGDERFLLRANFSLFKIDKKGEQIVVLFDKSTKSNGEIFNEEKDKELRSLLPTAVSLEKL